MHTPLNSFHSIGVAVWEERGGGGAADLGFNILAGGSAFKLQAGHLQQEIVLWGVLQYCDSQLKLGLIATSWGGYATISLSVNIYSQHKHENISKQLEINKY